MVWRVWGFGLQVRGFRVSLWLGDSRVLVMGDVSFRVSGLTWRSGRRDGTKRCELKAVAYNCVYWGDSGAEGVQGFRPSHRGNCRRLLSAFGDKSGY